MILRDRHPQARPSKKAKHGGTHGVKHHDEAARKRKKRERDARKADRENRIRQLRARQ